MDGYGLTLADPAALASAHAVVLASPHRVFLDDAAAQLFGPLGAGGVVIDVKAKLGLDPWVWAP